MHPSWKTKMLFWAVTPFVSSKFWRKHIYVDTLNELHAFVPASRLLLPKVAFINDKIATEDLESSWFA